MNPRKMREGVEVALEALEDGDTLAPEALLLNLADEINGSIGSTAKWYRCRVDGCSREYEHPGLRAHHELLAHGVDL